jgi:hypothetical protein
MVRIGKLESLADLEQRFSDVEARVAHLEHLTLHRFEPKEQHEGGTALDEPEECATHADAEGLDEDDEAEGLDDEATAGRPWWWEIDPDEMSPEQLARYDAEVDAAVAQQRADASDRARKRSFNRVRGRKP